jgi:hypothetical protein
LGKESEQVSIEENDKTFGDIMNRSMLIKKLLPPFMPLDRDLTKYDGTRNHYNYGVYYLPTFNLFHGNHEIDLESNIDRSVDDLTVFFSNSYYYYNKSNKKLPKRLKHPDNKFLQIIKNSITDTTDISDDNKLSKFLKQDYFQILHIDNKLVSLPILEWVLQQCVYLLAVVNSNLITETIALKCIDTHYSIIDFIPDRYKPVAYLKFIQHFYKYDLVVHDNQFRIVFKHEKKHWHRDIPTKFMTEEIATAIIRKNVNNIQYIPKKF